MADNRQAYGFRMIWGGTRYPQPIECIVASNQAFAVNGGMTAGVLQAGDPVIRLTTGGVNLCDGSEGAGGSLAPFGIVVGVGPYYDATRGYMVRGKGLPSATVYSTNLERQSKVYVVPLDRNQVWEVDCDDKVTATTKAAYQAFIGENCDAILRGASGTIDALPALDISSHAGGTTTLIWNIVGISPTLDNQDFSGSNVKLLVRANVIQNYSAGVAGI